MAKKGLKNLPKRSNMAKFENSAESAPTAEKATSPDIATTSQPASTSQVDAHTSTRLSFFNFVTIATTESIKYFLALAATTRDGENLLYLWERAYKDGYKSGKRSLLRSCK
jgi:hypothetical protein